jgi:Xaa-Pro aminopeptidase
MENRDAVWYPFAIHPGLEARVGGWLNQVRARVRYGALCPEQQRDLCGVLDEMRLIKDAHEQDVMRRAAAISARAHIRAMQLSARMLREGKDVREYHLDAELLHEFRLGGSQYPAYGSIVAAGANACVLHYRADAAPVRTGELVLIDAGCELDGYASDITRTFPANGQFTGPQRVLYDLVLASARSGRGRHQARQPLQRPARRHGARAGPGHAGRGPAGQEQGGHGGRRDRQPRLLQVLHAPHRPLAGHDVHDCGSYVEPSQVGEVSERRDPLSNELIKNRPSRVLQPGMVLTIEPGIYVRPGEGVPEQYHNIGIRIEDDAIVTPSGCELISRGVR